MTGTRENMCRGRGRKGQESAIAFKKGAHEEKAQGEEDDRHSVLYKGIREEKGKGKEGEMH